MKPTARQTNNKVAWASAIAVDDAISLDNSDAKACEVVIAWGIEIRKNCGFSACKCTARINTTITKTVELDVELIETDSLDGNKKLAFELTADINRKDFVKNIFKQSFLSIKNIHGVVSRL